MERIPYRKTKAETDEHGSLAGVGAETVAAKPSAAIIYDAIIYKALKPTPVVIIRHLRVFVSRT